MKRAKQPVIVYERKGADGRVTFYHHITIHGNRERVRLEALGRHRYNSRSYLLAQKAAEKAAMVKSADIFRGDYGVIENRGGVQFIELIEEHCAGKAREKMRIGAARLFWKRTKLSQVTTRKVEEYKKELMRRYANKTAFELFTITCKAVLRNAFEEGWIRRDPARRVQNPPNVATTKSPLLTCEEARIWLEWKSKARNSCTTKSQMEQVHKASCFMLLTGLLWADIKDLTFADIADGYVELIRSKNRSKQHAKSYCLALSPEAIDVVGSGKSHSLLFHCPTSNQILLDCLRFIAADLGIKKKVNIRTFRHTLLTQMALNGAGAHAIQSVAGHSRITMSQEYVRRKDQLQIQSLTNVYGV
jgi:site-specific recombinase XerD